MTPTALTFPEAARIVREGVRDKTYELCPVGEEIASYLRAKRKRLTDSSYLDRESSLDKLARHFPDLRIEDFEPQAGTERVEEFLDAQWGKSASGTYNKNLSYLREFFRFEIQRERLHGDPTLLIESARKGDVHRTTFTGDQRRKIIAEQESRRDRICLRLLLDYGIRKGALRAVQFKHFDHERRQLTIFSKGRKVRDLPLPEPALWMDLERHILDAEAEPHHFLLCARKRARRAYGEHWLPERSMSDSGAHSWWYRCLGNAGIVAEGTSEGEHMHKARHTAGQRVLDATGDLKLTQRVLGHASIQTTGDIYVDYDNAQLAAKLADVLSED